MLSLSGKVAIITGAGSVGPGWGNGRATAALFARQGAIVFLVDLKESAVAETKRIILEEGNSADTYCCNMMVSKEVEKMVSACIEKNGRVDILVNNVGGSEPGEPATMLEDAWDRQIDFNLKTAFLGCKYVLPHFESQQSGVIINISSVAGLRNSKGRTHVGYSASKAGLIQMTRSTAGAYAKKGIRCNTVVPGLMHTPLVEHRLTAQLSVSDADDLIARRNALVPIGRMGTGWDVAHAALFLASDEAGFITGTEIIVDGGYTTYGPG